MRTWRFLALATLPTLLVSGLGCVDRRFVVTTNVPGAQVYLDDQPVGASPADGRWDYAGYYKFTAVAPGYEPTVQRIRFRPKWFEYPPLDFFAEVLWPFRIEDVRHVELELFPARPVNPDSLISEAEQLRSRGQQLPPSQVPEKPKPTPVNPPPSPTAAPPPAEKPPEPIKF